MRFPAHIPWLGCPGHEGDEVPHQFGEQFPNIVEGGGYG